MRLSQSKSLAVGVAMLAAAWAAYALTPRIVLSEQQGRIDLETLVPKEFGNWKIDTSIVPITVSPDVQAKLDQIYNQVLARTYVNRRGERIMLSIAYGGDQSDSMQVHLPEVCYPAQGFQVLRREKGQVDLGLARIPVKRLVAQHQSRIEPITYWITVGERTVTGGLDRKLAQIAYGIEGKVPDGLLFRVSSIAADHEAAYGLQQAFARDLYTALGEDARARLYGAADRRARLRN